MKRSTLIRNLQDTFNLNAVASEEFESDSWGGIWIRDDICKPETNFYPYADGTADETNKLNDFLRKAGWFAEPHDSETIMLWEV